MVSQPAPSVKQGLITRQRSDMHVKVTSSFWSYFGFIIAYERAAHSSVRVAEGSPLNAGIFPNSGSPSVCETDLDLLFILTHIQLILDKLDIRG